MTIDEGAFQNFVAVSFPRGLIGWNLVTLIEDLDGTTSTRCGTGFTGDWDHILTGGNGENPGGLTCNEATTIVVLRGGVEVHSWAIEGKCVDLGPGIQGEALTDNAEIIDWTAFVSVAPVNFVFDFKMVDGQATFQSGDRVELRK